MSDSMNKTVKTGAKRIHSSSTEESDVSVCTEQDNNSKQERKRHHVAETAVSTELCNMDIHAVLARIEKRFDGLATKDDFIRMKEELTNLTTTFMEKITTLEGKVFDMEAQKEKLDQEVRQLKKKTETLHNMMRGQENKMKQVEKEQNDLEQYSRRGHLRVFRVPEQDKETAEDCVRKVCRIFTDCVGVEIKPCNIEVAHRTGRRGSDKPRPILVRFFDRKLRDQVLVNRRRLKGKGTSIGEDLTAANYKLLRSAMEHSATMSAWSSGGRILAKAKNGVIVRINIHTDLDEAFKRAMSPADISVDEDRYI